MFTCPVFSREHPGNVPVRACQEEWGWGLRGKHRREKRSVSQQEPRFLCYRAIAIPSAASPPHRIFRTDLKSVKLTNGLSALHRPPKRKTDVHRFHQRHQHVLLRLHLRLPQQLSPSQPIQGIAVEGALLHGFFFHQLFDVHEVGGRSRGGRQPRWINAWGGGGSLGVSWIGTAAAAAGRALRRVLEATHARSE